jgi:hypothetical protein
MDAKLQTLARKAVMGDPDAGRQLFMEKRRIGQLYTELPSTVEIKYGTANLSILDKETIVVWVDYKNQWVINEANKVYFSHQVFKYKDGLWVYIPAPQYDSDKRGKEAGTDYSNSIYADPSIRPAIASMLTVKLNQMFADPEAFPRLAGIAENNRQIKEALDTLAKAETKVEEMTTLLGQLFVEQAKL